MERRPPIAMSVRRGSLKLKALGKSHGALHMLLWQAREAQSTLLAAAAAQKTLFNDIAAWASSENRALSDVCSCASELSSLYGGALTQLALAFKSFRKEVSLVLEGEKRCDVNQKRLQDAEQKRIKLRRQVLRVQNRTISEGARQSGDFTQMQTQLAEAERTAERTHVEACEASREQEAVKLVVMRAALTKLAQSHITLASHVKTIFEGNCELSNLLPEPPPPGDPLSCIRYTSYDNSKEIVDRVKRQVNIESGGASTASRRSSGGGSTRPLSTSTPVTSPNSSMWSASAEQPSAPRDVYSPPSEPPPPYNTSYLSSSPTHVLSSRLTNSSVSNYSPRRSDCYHATSGDNFDNGSFSSNSPSSSVTSSIHHSYAGINNHPAGLNDENRRRSLFSSPNHHHRNSSTVSVGHLFMENNLSSPPTGNQQTRSYVNLPLSPAT